MPNPLLSKSAFKLGLECPRKLAYKREGYPSRDTENEYLQFFSDGGFMVEAIARALHPEGRTVEPAPGQSAAAATAAALAAAAATCTPLVLFEATFEHAGCSVRVDILHWRPGHVDLIEVKSKSFNSDESGSNPFRGAKGEILSPWRPYLQDLAFQTMVVRDALGSGATVTPTLCLVDNAKTCTQDSIFRQIELIPRPEREFGLPSARYIGDPARLANDHFLNFVDATADVEELLSDSGDGGVVATAQRLAAAIGSNTIRQLAIVRNSQCRDCEYRDASTATDPRNGFAECWEQWADGQPHLLELYKVGGLSGKTDKGAKAIQGLLDRGICTITDIPTSVLGDTTKSDAARRLRQIECAQTGQEWRSAELRSILKAVQPPFHFVDFETSRLAVPYHAGMHPNEQISFQFSCHTLAEPNATELKHREWINFEDHWPNVEFAKALRAAIGDDGHMLVWSHHERSALKEIRQQIIEYRRGPADLADWLEPLTRDQNDANPGRIVDLYRLCEKHYLHPQMNGRSSLKLVLPAVWSNNPYLHADPWFKDYYKTHDGQAVSPYDTLPDIAVPGGTLNTVREGTGAMRAYQDMLYGLRRNDAAYRDACRRSLLQYCKLDTLAMVIIWKHWMRA